MQERKHGVKVTSTTVQHTVRGYFAQKPNVHDYGPPAESRKRPTVFLYARVSK